MVPHELPAEISGKVWGNSQAPAFLGMHFCQDMLLTLIERSKWKAEVFDALGDFKGMLWDQAGAAVGVASNSKDLCKIQEKQTKTSSSSWKDMQV